MIGHFYLTLTENYIMKQERGKTDSLPDRANKLALQAKDILRPISAISPSAP